MNGLISVGLKSILVERSLYEQCGAHSHSVIVHTQGNQQSIVSSHENDNLTMKLKLEMEIL